MAWYEYNSTTSSPTKSDITPPVGQDGRFDTDNGTELELMTVDGWVSVSNHDGGIFYPTREQILALDLVNNRYRFRIQKATEPTLANVKVYSYKTGIYENSFYRAT